MGNRGVLLVDLVAPSDASLGAQLAQCGFTVRSAKEIESARSLLSRYPALLMVVRAGNPSSIDFEDLVRAADGIPVVVVSTVGDEDSIVRFLETGAETVLLSPISRRELAARLRSLLRSRDGSVTTSIGRHTKPIRVDNLGIDLDARAVTKDERHLPLTPTEFRLLKTLARQAGQVVTHADLLSEVWGKEWIDSPANLRLYVRYLRRKIEEDHRRPRLLLNERGVGYRLAGKAMSVTG